MNDYIKRIRTETGDKQIDYTALANLPVSDKTLSVSGEFADAAETGKIKEKASQLEKEALNLKTETAELNEDIEQIKSTAYTDTFFKNFFALQRTGKKYTVKFPLWETSQISTGEKLK